MTTTIASPPAEKRARVLLSLDGGGVRGLSTLLILEHLMKGINPESPPKPCEVFDLIGGTSTGGLIAIMLGRLKMDVPSCIDAYLKLSVSAFQPKRNKRNFWGIIKDTIGVKGKFESGRLEQAIKEVVKLKLEDEDALLREDGEPGCRVFVCALRKDIAKPARLRSYPTRSANPVEGCKIWEAGRATSAATSFFDSIAIGKFGEEFIDGATGCNNPVRHVLDEAYEIWTPEVKINCIISIGTGQPSMAAFGDNLKEVATSLIKIATDTENTAEEFLRANRDLREQKRYFRFNVPKGLEKVGLEEYEKKATISSSTNHYLNERMIQDEVENCLNSLSSCNDLSPLEPSDSIDTEADKIFCLSKDEKECLASFYLTDYSTYRSQVSKRHPETLEWLRENEQYKAWVSAKSSFLWISGNPGCGKTVLSAFLLDQLDLMAKNTNTKVAYFFCDDKDETQRTAQALLRGVIHQLLVATPRLIKHAMLYWTAQKKNMLASLDALWKIFLAIATDPTVGGTYCVFDALDECEEISREDLLSRLGKHFMPMGNQDRAGHMNVVLTSRPYENIRCFLERFSVIRLKTENEGGNISKDITTFISSEVKRLAENRGYGKSLEEKVQNALEKGADGMFLWVSLIVKDLQRTPTQSVEKKLNAFPQGLYDLYAHLLSSLEDTMREMAQMILLWVVTAMRPLKLSELATALQIKQGDTQSIKIDKERLKSLEGDVALCGPILKIQEGVVHLVHQSAKEFMTNSATFTLPSTFRISIAEANSQLAISCLTYLAFDEFNKGPLKARSYYDDYVFERRLQEYSFLKYAAVHWMHHVKQGEEEDIDILLCFDRLLESELKLGFLHETWCFLEHLYFEPISSLQFSVYYGIFSLVRRFLDGVTSANSGDGGYGGALWVAAYRGHEAVVKLLLDRGADINTQGGKYGNALQAGACRGYEAVVKLLLDRGADINAKGGKYGNALQAATAAYRDHEAVVKLLLDRGADINAKGGKYGNALQAAAYMGHEAMVKLLLDRGADINAKGGKYGNALQTAAYMGHEAMVKLLLDRGADINAKGGFYGNALQATAYENHETVMKLLLDRGADINAKGGEYGNALQAAACMGHEAMMKLLLDRGADINAKGGKYRNALQAGACRGYEAVVKLLLDQGADINARCRFYGNALQAAAYMGREAMVKLLLDRGADINAEGGEYGNTLQAAACRGHEMVVKLLLNRGANINAKGGKYGNALQAATAAYRDHEAVVKLLLDRGADINAKGGKYGNALQAAAYMGREAMVKLLLDRGADINAKDGKYGNALQAAACMGHEAMVKLLLDRGADINAEGGKYRNVLQAAMGCEVIVKLLLDHVSKITLMAENVELGLNR